MAIKNIKGLLLQATQVPMAIQAALPAGAPQIGTMLVEATAQLPDVPDFPVELPDLPAVPALPGGLAEPALKSPFFSTITPTAAPVPAGAVNGILLARKNEILS